MKIHGEKKKKIINLDLLWDRMYSCCLTSNGNDCVEALVPKGKVKVVTYQNFIASLPCNFYQWSTVITAESIHLTVDTEILSSSTT